MGRRALLLRDILAQLIRPGRDPREDLPPPIFKQGVLKLDDLSPGMELTGAVLNVVDFGAFVDIGLHDTGLVHISQLSTKFVRDPHEVVSVGDIVRVWVHEIDKTRRRVSLSMIPPGAERSARERGPNRGRSAGEGGEQPADGSGENRRGDGQRRGRSRSDRARRGGAERGAAASGATVPAVASPSEAQLEPALQGAAGQDPGQQGSARQGGPRQGGRSQGPGRQGQYRQNQNRPGGGRNQQGGNDRGGQQRRSQGAASRPPKPARPPKPLPPLTKDMKAGKEPLRTFGDLKQFMELKSQPDSPPSDADGGSEPKS